MPLCQLLEIGTNALREAFKLSRLLKVSDFYLQIRFYPDFCSFQKNLALVFWIRGAHDIRIITDVVNRSIIEEESFNSLIIAAAPNGGRLLQRDLTGDGEILVQLGDHHRPQSRDQVICLHSMFTICRVEVHQL